MIVFWLTILLGLEPGPSFGIMGEFKSSAECEAAKVAVDEQYRPRLACLGVVKKPFKET